MSRTFLTNSLHQRKIEWFPVFDPYKCVLFLPNHDTIENCHIFMMNMNSFQKKILVILPVVILSFFFLRAKYQEEYVHVHFKRLAGFVLSVLLFYACVIFIVVRKRQHTFFEALTQSSFFVYVFMVMTLTGYFILFKEVSSHDWWGKMVHRVETRNKVNLQPFQLFKIYSKLDIQVVGNFVMLLPLGIYLPLLYSKFRKFGSFFIVLLICLLVSVGIELLQLATSYRSTDIDDVILNTLGGGLGFIIYQIMRAIVNRVSNQSKSSLSVS